MSFTRTTESGDFETPSQTIGALIAREWDDANAALKDPKPVFTFDENKTNPKVGQQARAHILFRDGDTVPIPERTALGHDMIGMGQQVIIDVHAESQKRRLLIEFEIHRILRKFRPIGNNGFTPIKKSDETSNSPIHDYDEILPEFIAFDADVPGQERSNKSSAILTVIMEYQFA